MDIPHIHVFTDEKDYVTQQIEAYARAKRISHRGDADIVYYDIRNDPDRIGLDDLSFKINYNCFLEYNDVTFEEIDDQIVDIYREQKSSVSYYDNCRRNPFVMIVDGISKIKDTDEFLMYLDGIIELVTFLNIYILVIL